MKPRLSTTYLVYIFLLHAALVYLIFRWLKEDKILFIASEALVFVSIYVALRIYRNFQKPAEFVAAGIEQIKDKDFTVKFVPTGNREVDDLVRVYNLMIDQLRQERTQQQEQQFFTRQLIDASPIAILIFDYDGRITTANAAACELFQSRFEELEARSLAEVPHPLVSQLAELKDGETRSVKGSGIETYRVQRSHFMDRGFPRSFLLIAELTSEILETEKKAYSKVIRMMAHEVNNSIGAVNSILDVAKSVMEDDESGLKSAVQVAIERNDRLNHFMRRFADVVRLPPPNLAPGDLGKLAADVVQLMQPQAARAGVRLSYTPPKQTVRVVMDSGQMEQVLVNVVKNALEACTPGQFVDVQVTARQLIVRDNGLPIDAALSQNLFNPFYSTKPTGQGIGLTLTREILLNHGFSFSLRTGEDGWTEFGVNY
ncbi:sensor histidine kinase [Tellurirhabdus rosea]|uniref:sensor histidine kinase n=1 Tax=Tellurirhabdus rosea TaxID=2674997 RepID=UPI002251B4FB|nr:ATP-binding protein [Tellurirhabdus rosea]